MVDYFIYVQASMLIKNILKNRLLESKSNLGGKIDGKAY